MKTTLLAALAAVTMLACHHETRGGDGPMENAGEKVDRAADRAGDKIDRAAEKVGDDAEKAGDKLKEKTRRD